MTKIRYQKYADMSCRGNIQPEKLPPSERACFYHGLRTFSQIMEWKNIDEERGLNLLDWGWKKNGSSVAPITTDKEYAPLQLQHIIRCNCKSFRPCSTNACSCRRHGLLCLPTCGECRGEDCSNCAPQASCENLGDDSGNEEE